MSLIKNSFLTISVYRIRLIIVIATFFLSFNAIAQPRKYSNEFLNIGAGARALGMGGSITALSNDVTAGFWNPAGLTNINSRIQGNLMHANYFGGLAAYDYAGVAAAIDKTSYLGASIIRFGIDDIKDTSELKDKDGNINYDRIKSISAADYAFIVSYARKDSQNVFSYGANAKIIHRRIGPYARSWGFGIDAGATYRLNKWTFGLMAKDITTTFNAWSYSTASLEEVFLATGNELPSNSIEITLPQLSLGTAFSSPITNKFNINTELDIIMTTDGPRNVLISYTNSPFSFDPRLGLEVDYKKTVFIRGGLNNLQTYTSFEGKEEYQIQPAIGAGIRIKNLFIDYALTNISSGGDVLYTNVFSLRLDINQKP